MWQGGDYVGHTGSETQQNRDTAAKPRSSSTALQKTEGEKGKRKVSISYSQMGNMRHSRKSIRTFCWDFLSNKAKKKKILTKVKYPSPLRIT